MGGVGLQSLISAWTDQQPAFWTVDLGTHQLEKKNNNNKYTQVVSVTVVKTVITLSTDRASLKFIRLLRVVITPSVTSESTGR